MWTQVIRRNKLCSRRAGDSWWLRSLTMVLAGNKANCISSVSDTKKTIPHHSSSSSSSSLSMKKWSQSERGCSKHLLERFIFYVFSKDPSSNTGLKMQQKLLSWVLLPLGWVDLIFLTRLVFLEFPWWPVWTLCLQDILNSQKYIK